MYAVLPESGPDLLAVCVSGKLTESDYASLHPWLDAQLASHPCPGLLVVMKDFHGWDSLGALIEDAKLDMAHHDDVSRVAMVGEKSWQKWMTWFVRPFVAEIRYFDMDELEEAKAWASAG